MLRWKKLRYVRKQIPIWVKIISYRFGYLSLLYSLWYIDLWSLLILLILFINWKYTSECTMISSAFTLHDQGKKVYHIWTKEPIPYKQINYALPCVKCSIFSPFTLIPLLIYNLADFWLHHYRFSRLNQETTAANEFTCLQALQVFRSSLKIHMCKDFPKWRGLRIWRSRQNS